MSASTQAGPAGSADFGCQMDASLAGSTCHLEEWLEAQSRAPPPAGGSREVSDSATSSFRVSGADLLPLHENPSSIFALLSHQTRKVEQHP